MVPVNHLMNLKQSLLHQAFESAAHQYPNRIAVTDRTQSMTYKALNEWSNALSIHLIEMGVQPGDAVAISAERSVGFTAAILAVLKAGGAYVPLDPAYPVDRLSYCMEQSRSIVLITDGSVPELEKEIPIVSIQQFAGARCETPANVEIHDGQPAYIIFTSGSTGRPKGVVIPHRAIVNHMIWMQQEFNWTSEDVFLQKTAAGFDASVWEFHAPLGCGARMVIAASNPYDLANAIESHGVTVAQFVPTVLKLFLEQGMLQHCHSLRLLFCGGEALLTSLVRDVQSELPVPLVNLYGPTEASIDTTYRICLPGEEHTHREIDLGAAIPNAWVHIVDKELNPVGPGGEGELVIGGIGLAIGYCGLPEVTMERFVTMPNGGERIYRTGDQVRIRPSGQIVFVGRQDFQLKLRGQRMESGEIEEALRECSEVLDALVTVKEEAGEQWLVAYVRTTLSKWDEQKVRDELAERLPSYMFPSFYAAVEQFPYLENGKLDRNTITAQPFRRRKEKGTSLNGQWEIRLAAIWSSLLGQNMDHAEESFIAVGGHSLLAMRLAGRLSTLSGIPLDHGFVFQYPTIREQARYLEEKNAGWDESRTESTEASNAEEVGGEIPLSYGQQGILFFEEAGEASAYHIAYSLDMKKEVTEELIKQSISTLMKRHLMLTATITQGETGEYVQQMNPELADRPISVIRVDEDRLMPELVAKAEEKFDLQREGGFRATIYHTLSGSTLLVVFHHLFADGWSVQMLLEELQAELELGDKEHGSTLTDHEFFAPNSFVRFSKEQRGKDYSSSLEYWKRVLHGVPETSRLPMAMRKGRVQTSRGAVLRFTADPDLERRITEYGKMASLSEFSLQLSAVASIIAEFSGQRDLCIGIPSANRKNEADFSSVGNFVNVIPFRIQFPEGATLGTVARDIMSSYLDMMPFEDTPIELVIPELKHHRSEEYRPLFQVMFTYNRFLQQPLERFACSAVLGGTAKCDLSFIVDRCGDQSTYVLEYCTDLFTLETVEAIRDAWLAAMERLLLEDENIYIHEQMYQPEESLSQESAEQPADSNLREEIREMWRELFQSDEISSESNFFALGGHSLLAMKMMAMVNRRYNTDLPVSTLLKYPTVQGLAHVITYQVKPTGVVPLVAQEGKPKLWFIHPAGGALWCYREMSEVLGENFDVWGIETEPVPETGKYEDDLVQMARRYAEYIRSAQTEGPYYVCGYSFGGNVAYEIMKSFYEQGETTGMLTLIDCHRSRPRAFEDLEFVISYAAKFVEGEVDRLNYDKLTNVEDSELYEYLLDLGKAGGHLHEDASLEEVRKGLLVWKANNRAVHRYEMDGPYYGKTLFIRADLSEQDSTAGWDSYLQGDWQTVSVPAHHFSIYKSPSAEACGRKIAEVIGAGKGNEQSAEVMS